MTATLNGLWGPQLRPSTLGKPEANPQSSLSYCFLICENLSSAQPRGPQPCYTSGAGKREGSRRAGRPTLLHTVRCSGGRAGLEPGAGSSPPTA